MKSQPNEYHISLAPTSRARCRRCKKPVQKGAVRIVVTAFVKRNFTTRFTRCASCVDASLATAVSTRYGNVARLRATPEVEPAAAEKIRATIARLAVACGP
jgi:hypothetical protein